MDYYNLFTAELEQMNVLKDDEAERIASSFEILKLPKNELFLEADKRCSKVGYLLTGILCSFIWDNEGYEVVKHFIEPKQFFTDLESYEHSKPAKLNIIAITDSVILNIQKQENDKLQKQIPLWEYVQGMFASRSLKRMIQMQNFLHFGSATDKYNYLVKNYPNIARHVPLKYIASYLRITQSSLSRLRRENI